MRPRLSAPAGTVLASIIILTGSPEISPAGEATAFDHRAFDRVLGKYATSDGVDYAAVAGAADLESYLRQLEGADPASLSASERLAFWINTYNAHTINAVAVHRPSKSIREILLPGRSGEPGPVWKAPMVRVAGRAYTLDEVEHDRIRGEFKDPRVHFALVCAAASCPPLRREAYTGARLDQQLEDQGHRFLHGHAKGCRVDAARGILYVSEIFRWYKEDFGDDAAVGRFILRYLPDSVEKGVLSSGHYRVSTIPFDWSLNDVRGSAEAR